MQLPRLVMILLTPALLCGCAGEHYQSAVHPAGPPAEKIAALWWFLLIVCTAVFVIVMVLTLMAIGRPRDPQASGPRLGNRFIVISGIILPSVVLVIMLIYSLGATVSLKAPQTQLTIRVTGHQWWWEIEYLDHGIIGANEIHIPVNTPVRLELIAGDVIHSFWVPNLHGKMDLLPEHTNHFWIQADRTGIFRGQCAEYCGVQHALMGFMVVVHEADDFERWVEHHRKPPPPPADEYLQRGQRAFFTSGCNTCHAISGTEAVARAGPDLTHIGSRLTIGAATLDNTRGNLAGWVANPQPLKPGNHMVRSFIAPEDFHPLIDYLESLK